MKKVILLFLIPCLIPQYTYSISKSELAEIIAFSGGGALTGAAMGFVVGLDLYTKGKLTRDEILSTTLLYPLAPSAVIWLCRDSSDSLFFALAAAVSMYKMQSLVSQDLRKFGNTGVLKPESTTEAILKFLGGEKIAPSMFVGKAAFLAAEAQRKVERLEDRAEDKLDRAKNKINRFTDEHFDFKLFE